MWSYWFVNTLSGEKILRLMPSDSRCRTVINGVGDGQHTFRPFDASRKIPASLWKELKRPWASTIVACWNNVPKYAGIVQGGTWSPRKSGELTIQTAEFRVFFSRRYGWTVVSYTPTGVRAWTSKSLRGQMTAAMRYAFHSVTPGDNWDMRLVLPASDESGSASRTLYSYEFRTIEDFVSEIQDTADGPDLAIEPRWDANGRLEWVARMGTPTLTGPAVTYMPSAPYSGAMDLEFAWDGSMQATGMFAQGLGTEQDMKVGLAGPITGSLIPAVHSIRAFKTIDKQDVLDARALGELRAFREMTTQFGLNGRADHLFAPGGVASQSATLGSPVNAYYAGDPVEEAGWKTGKVIGMSFDLSQNVTLEVQ